MAERPDSNTPEAEGDVELPDEEQKQVTEIAMTKQEFVKQIADTSQLRRSDRP